MRFVDGLSRSLKTEIAFDEKALYKGDLVTLVDIFVNLVVNGILSPDEARVMFQYAALEIEGMDIPRVAGSMMKREEEVKEPGEDDDTTDSGKPPVFRAVA